MPDLRDSSREDQLLDMLEEMQNEIEEKKLTIEEMTCDMAEKKRIIARLQAEQTEQNQEIDNWKIQFRNYVHSSAAQEDRVMRENWKLRIIVHVIVPDMLILLMIAVAAYLVLQPILRGICGLTCKFVCVGLIKVFGCLTKRF